MAYSFQDIIFKLQGFWREQGCLLVQPLDMEVGAGTFHPATFLRSVSQEPWSVAYVQPCRRPQDGRYGNNPNRLQRYYQFQVAMKPSPPEFQALFLKSLETLGVNRQMHDIRFVEDDWESPTLGAWGLGWEVWMDGMEVCQFTYFQEAGGLPVKPVMGEITYGLERLAMLLQEVDDIYQLVWDGNISYGDLYRQNEQDQSTYNFEHVNVDLQLLLFDRYEKECQKLLSLALPISAYDITMKCSHIFNLLSARGTLSVTERARYITRVRHCAKSCAESYYESRRSLGFPLSRNLVDQGKRL